MMMVRDDRTERGPFGRRPDPSSNPTYHSLTVYASVDREAALGAPRRANRRAVGSATDRCVAPRELGSAAEISAERDTDR